MIVFQKSKYRSIIGIVLLIMLCVLSTPMPAVRAEQPKGSVSLSYEVPNTVFSLYKIGEVDSNGKMHLTGDFTDYAVDLESDNVAQTLEAYIIRDQLEPIAEAQTGENKKLKFDNLDFAVYLLCGETRVVGTTRYIASSALIYLPLESGGTVVKDVNVQVKYEKEIVSEKKKLSLIIVWNDGGDKQYRPPNMMVQLFRDGILFDTVELNEENNWKYEWTDLDGNYVWTVVEKDAPEGYIISRDKEGFTYVIINTKEDLSETSTGQPSTSQSNSVSNQDKLPQTGQFWWPVFMLICIGLFFLIIGFYYKRKDTQ